jgi:hypothetical protein
MNKIISLTITIMFIVIFTGCFGKNYIYGQFKSNYNTVNLYGGSKEKGALIKVADDLIIWEVDGIRKVNVFKLMFGKGIDSLILKEGKHTLGLSFFGTDINIGEVYYKPGHEYFINYLVVKSKIYYWIEDLKNNKVVYGKKKTKKDFE